MKRIVKYKNRLRCSTIVLAMSLTLTAGAHSGIFPKAGTTAATFLKIGVGARPMALGGNYVALANDASALYWNPAGIMHVEGLAFSGTHTEMFAGINHDYISFAAKLNDASAIGIDLIYLNSGDIEQTTLQEQDGTGIFYDASDFSLGLTYARKLSDRFTVAVKGKYIQQSIFNEQASTFAVDFGTLYKTGYRGLTIGMNFANFGGSMRMTGNDLTEVREDPVTGTLVDTELKTENWPLPILFRVGVAMNLVGPESGFFENPQSRLTLAVDGNHPNDNSETIGSGLEYAWNELLFLRFGYVVNHDVENISFGSGLQWRASGWTLRIDYAYSHLEILEDVQRFTLSVDL